MCGLAGVVMHPDVWKNAEDRKVIIPAYEAMMKTIQSRGTHACGSVAIDENSVYHMLKLAEPIGKVMATDAWKDHLNTHAPDGTVCLMGHTRNKTHGANTDDNAHPFVMGQVIGAHNGIIFNFEEIAKDLGVKAWEVDSQAIFALLDRYDGVINDSLAKLDGYFATSWWKNGSLYLARSDTADLYVGYALPIRTLVWSSFRHSIESVFKSIGLKPKEMDIFQPNTDTVYKYTPARFSGEQSYRTVYSGTFTKARKTHFNGANPSQSYQTRGGGAGSYVSQSHGGFQPYNDARGQSSGARFTLQEAMEEIRRVEAIAVSALKIAQEASDSAARANQKTWSLKDAIGRLARHILMREGVAPTSNPYDERLGQLEVDLANQFTRAWDATANRNGAIGGTGYVDPAVRGQSGKKKKKDEKSEEPEVSASGPQEKPGLLPAVSTVETGVEVPKAEEAGTVEGTPTVAVEGQADGAAPAKTVEQEVKEFDETTDEIDLCAVWSTLSPEAQKVIKEREPDDSPVADVLGKIDPQKCVSCQEEKLSRGLLIPLPNGFLIHEACENVPMWQ